MKYNFTSIVLLLLLVCGICANAQQPSKSCPRNFDGKKLTVLKKNPKKTETALVAFDIVVQEIESGYSDRPYFKGALDNNETLWIASMMNNLSIVQGQKLRILGYINRVEKDDEIGMQFNKNGLQVRAFAILDTTTKQLIFSDAFETEAKTWQSGNLPK